MSILDMFWYKLPQKLGRVVTNFGPKFQIFKSFIFPKIQAQYNEYGSEEKNFYYIFILTFDRVNFPLQRMVNDVVENFLWLRKQKLRHNSMSMAAKKKNFYYIFNLTFDRVNIPLQSMFKM